MVFYLQQHTEDGRWLIDSTFPQSAHRVKESCEAATWLEAKKAFGFPLSVEQEFLVAKQRKQRERAA